MSGWRGIRYTDLKKILYPGRERDGPPNGGHGGFCSRRGPLPRGMRPPLSSSQSPLSSVSACGENCARSLAPPLPTARGAAGAPFGLAKREMGRARSKEKSVWRAAVQWPSALKGGRRIGACSDLALPSGTLCSSAIFVTAVPWRMVRRSSGWSSHCLCSSFRCRSTIPKRGFQRGETAVSPLCATRGHGGRVASPMFRVGV